MYWPANTPAGVKRSGLGAHACCMGYYSCIKACLKCCGSGMLTIASGREFQSLIFRWKYKHLYQFLLARIVLNALFLNALICVVRVGGGY